MVVAGEANNLPVPLTTFVGRRREASEVCARLERTRLVTLTGAGGAGKSRLALEVAATRKTRHRDGVWLVELAGLAEPLLVAHTVAGVLDVPEQAGRALPAVLTESLHEADMLLLLDSCEHLLEPVAQLVLPLLAACRHLRVLTTSRERLGIPGETLWPVSGLGTPPERIAEASVTDFDAVRLFLDRAAAVDPGFQLTVSNAAAVAEICRRLDGLPLAIELAAARINALGAEQIRRRLDDRFRLLALESRDPLPHHRTLHSVVEWSYDLLSEPEQVLFERLAVFAGAFTMEAAEAVATEQDGTADFGDLLLRLVDKSLVTVASVNDSPRYRLLETLRAYGLERLRWQGGGEALSAQHATYFLDLAEQAWECLRGPQQAVWLDRLEAEHDDLRAALEWLLASSDVGGAMRLAGALGSFWDVHGHYTEGRVWLERALDADSGASARGRVRALYGLGLLALGQGDVYRARRACVEAARLAQRDGDLQGLAHSLHYLGFGALLDGDLDGAVGILRDSLDAAGKSGDSWLVGWSYIFLATVESARGAFAQASSHGNTAFRLLREVGEPKSVAWAALHLGGAAWGLGDIEEARTRTGEALRRFRVLNARWGLAEVFQVTGLLAGASRRWEQAAALLGTSEKVRKECGVASLSFLEEWRAAGIAEGRAAVGPQRFDMAYEHGRRWSLEAAVLAASEELGIPLPESPSSPAVADAGKEPAPAPEQAMLRKEGEYWAITRGGQAFHLKHTVGLSYLARLLREPEREFLALDLVTADAVGHRRGPAASPVGVEDRLHPGPGDAGPVLDARAKAEYRRRLRELAEELEEAEQWHDTGRAERARTEIDAVTDQLVGAVGLGGRDRKAASDSERARLNVTKALKSAVKRIAGQDPVLGRHLERSVRTGTYCCYAPDPVTRIAWRW
ncbi:ATP-binding protein [Streptomyces ochraceiscleroticus]|uniref:ATP-binding protein n=1 Tax=Streptomyces ochraceiscleroticus TaxID=47761 RepID=A0ABW1MKX0_9ACTN|nr:LuxR family transcriptional regulator [Streptomyces ochraceiscleroticus]